MPNSTQNYELVYAIQSVKLKHVKIGFTTDINQRLSSLQGGSSDELRVIGCWLGSVRDERQLHEELRRWRIHREWFQDSDDVLKLIAEKNQAIKSDIAGKLVLPLSKGNQLEIWESRRLSESEKYTARPGLDALADLAWKARQLSEDLPPHHGKVADQIAKDAQAAYDALEIMPSNRHTRQAGRPRYDRDGCTFCFKSSEQVSRLIAGDVASICNECALISYQLLHASEPEKRHCFHIQCGNGYVYSAETKADALRLWACDYLLIGDATLTYYYEPEENKEPETKAYKEWAKGKAGFIAVFRSSFPLDVPELSELKEKLAKMEAEVSKLKQELADTTANAAAMSREIDWLLRPRSLTLRERIIGCTGGAQ